MNCYAYPIIFDAIKNKNDNNLSIYFYDSSMIRIFKKDEFIILKDSEGMIYSDINSFNFFNKKPIDTILITCDKYGALFSEIFNRTYWRAAVSIQRAWKKSKKSL